MRIVFAGTPEFAVPALEHIYASGHEVVAVLTRPDRPQGRKRVLTPPPVKSAALRYAIPVLQPDRLRSDASALAACGAELMVTCAYGQILTEEVLALFPRGVWNIHASLLPAYRGAAPIPHAIMDGCDKTGVTIMRTELGLDTGGILLQEQEPIYDSDTCGTLSQRLAVRGAALMVRALALIQAGETVLTPQGEGFVCRKVVRTQVDFSRPAAEVSALIRGLSPAPISYGRMGELSLNFYCAEVVQGSTDEPCGSVLSDLPEQGLIVQCGEGAVRITRLQPAGGRVMEDHDFLNGRKLRKGMRFDQPVL